MQDRINVPKKSTDFPFILENAPLADKNYFITGGNAQFYCEPTNKQQFKQAIMFAQINNLDIFVLGSGANILISDEGFQGLVIRPQLKKIEIINLDKEKSAYVAAEAGAVFDDLIAYCLNHNLTGLEEFSGIPGTVGGSVYINIHYFEFLLSNFLLQAEVINKKTGEIMKVTPEWFQFGYDQSKLQNKDYYLLNATFVLKQSSIHETEFARGRYHEIIRHRKQRYPHWGTCGSFFRNFHEDEVTYLTNLGKKLIFVAYYLDKLGIKGELSVGDAQVSHQHANMIINRGSAKTGDIIILARLMQEKVHSAFGIIPQPECQLVGFNSYPLYQ